MYFPQKWLSIGHLDALLAIKNTDMEYMHISRS